MVPCDRVVYYLVPSLDQGSASFISAGPAHGKGNYQEKSRRGIIGELLEKIFYVEK